jgi:hypothetical protein
MVNFDSKVLPSLVESCMSRDRYHPTMQRSAGYCLPHRKRVLHLRIGDTSLRSSPVSVRLASHDDALGTARRSGTASFLWIGIEEGQSHCYDFCFHLAYSREDIRVERVGQEISLDRIVNRMPKLCPFRMTMVDGSAVEVSIYNIVSPISHIYIGR